MDMQTALTAARDSLTGAGLKAPNAKDPSAAKKSAEAFEAMFLGQMLQPMFSTVEVDETFGGGAAEEMWRGVMVEETAKQIARSGGIGIATVVQREMMRMQEVADGQD